eukprot:GHVL01021543.1.p1 GENE.GHVL01021543.1~~GHVL01021543.1.p1  ORF type:complete len:1454 (-),score=300.36 GHVL01021543.1:205-4023(-)
MFDSSFFNISQSEVALMDPQQRLMLELGFDALHQCGYDSISKLNKENIGVFIGCCNTDWSLMQVGNKTYQSFTSSYMTTGNSLCIISNRISYAFGLTGPSFTIDSACSSSLVALHVACTCLRDASCSRALVGGVNLILAPHIFIAFCKSRMLSPTNRCRSFDASADGYARGEGGGVIVMMRQEEVQRDSNLTVLGSVHGSYVNHVGRSASLTSPNGPAQQEVIRSALNNAGISPDEISYIESHGTGTALGDPIEIGALKAIFGNQNKKRIPLVIGALKTNIGHLEGAAGIAGLIKTLLVLQKGIAPPNLHFNKLNPHIDVTDFNAVFPSEHPVELVLPSTNAEHFFGGVSSFGFGGANAHVIVSCPIVSACSSNRVSTWMFTGQGCQYVNMGRSLYESEAAFRNAFDECDSIVVTDLSKLSLKTFIFVDNPTEENDIALDNTCRSQIAIFSFEYSLSQLWCSRGEHPSYVLGHSIGEYAAAVMAGIMTLKTALFMVSVRGDLMSSAPPGVMFACRCSETDALDVISSKLDESLRDEVSVAAVNGPKSVVLSGTEKAVSALINALNVSSKQLQVCGAFHSPLMRSCADEFARTVSNVNLQTPDESSDYPKLISCVTGKLASSDEICKVKYWSDHIIKPVRFLDAVEYCSNESRLLFEIGPSSHLIRMIKGSNIDNIQLYNSEEIISFPNYRSVPYKRRSCPWWNESHPIIPELVSVGNRKLQSKKIIDRDLIENLLKDHSVFGQAIFPAAGYVDLLTQTAMLVSSNTIITFSGVVFQQACPIEDPVEIMVESSGEISISARNGDNDFEINCVGSLVDRNDKIANFNIEQFNKSSATMFDVSDMYTKLKKFGLEYGSKFQTVNSVWVNQNEALGDVSLKHDLLSLERSMIIHPALLDGCFQVTACLLIDEDKTMIPFSIERFTIDTSLTKNLTSAVIHTIMRKMETGCAVFDISVMNSKGLTCVSLDGFTLRNFDRKADNLPRQLLWSVEWKPLKMDVIDVALVNPKTVVTSDESLIKNITGNNEISVFQLKDGCVIDLSVRINNSPVTIFFTDFLNENCDYEKCLSLVVSIIKQMVGNDVMWIFIPIRETPQGAKAGCVWGLARCARLENGTNIGVAEGSFMNILDCLKNNQLWTSAAINMEWEMLLDSPQRPENCGPRLKKAEIGLTEPLQLHLSSRGAIANLSVVPLIGMPTRPPEGHVRLRVCAVGLNFRDVLNVLDLYPGDPGVHDVEWCRDAIQKRVWCLIQAPLGLTAPVLLSTVMKNTGLGKPCLD